MSKVCKFILKAKEFNGNGIKFDKYSIETENGQNFGFAFRNADKVNKAEYKVPFAKVVEIDVSKMSFKDKVVVSPDGKEITYTTIYADVDDIKICDDQSLLASRAQQKMLAKLNIAE